MNPIVGWGLAVLAVAASWQAYGWQGVVMAVSVIVFWLLLQFSRALRAMKNAAGAPKGQVDSAVMLNAKLRVGMTMMQVITLTRSLGERVSETPEAWAWADAGASRVRLVFEGGKLRRWELERPESPTP
ncbi:MAG TPA: hypothetical protein VFL64_22230 [Rhizobacter sp.]|nr:hypothetical protein [Rhizobacter sp.]